MDNVTNGVNPEPRSNIPFPDVADQSPTDGNYTYKKYGFLQARNQGAGPIAFEVELYKIYENYKDKLRRDDGEQEKMKHPIRIKLESLKVDRDELLKQIEATKISTTKSIDSKVEQINNEIASIRRDPSSYQSEKPNRVAVIVGAVVISVLTLYLWIFYTSAGYSAFFKKFEASDINIANSLFDAKAISKAWSDGAPALVLVVTLPFIFLALGYLIHKFMLEKGRRKWFGLIALITITFAFDYIIAYEIVLKVYDLKAANSIENWPPYSFSKAFTDINFWLIIFAGFVTYLIWGFLFDKLMADYEKFDVVKFQIRLREKEIRELEKDRDKACGYLKEIEQRLPEIEKQIKTCEEDIRATFFKPKEFEHIIFQFSSGWFQFIEGGLLTTEEKKNSIRAETNLVMHNFIAKHNNPVIYENVQ